MPSGLAPYPEIPPHIRSGRIPETGFAFLKTRPTMIPDREVPMEDLKTKTNGRKLLVREYRRKFQTRENLKYYSPKDYRRAEKKYIRFCLATGKC